LKHYKEIRTTIDEFLSIVAEMNCPTFSELAEDNFQRIFNYIGVSDKLLINEILSLREFASDEEQDIEVDQLEAKYPNNAKIYFVKAYYAFKRNQISKSSYFYKKSIELDPSFGATYYNLGFNVEVYDKDFEEAKRLYEKAIELEPTNTRTYSNLAGLYSTVFKNPTEARKLLEAALKINPYDAETNYNLALVLHRDFNDFENARDHYETAIMIKEDFADAIHNYGMILSKHFKLYSKAKDQFLKVLELEPYNKKTLGELANLIEDEYKHYSIAKIYWDRFIKIEPNTAEDHYLYAMFLILHFESTEKELARKHYDNACSMDGSFKSEQAEILLR
jgi:tetratricopeptide (TPR) repeat protein